MSKWEQRYGSAWLFCEPQLLANGKYFPRLIISISKGILSTTEIQVNLKDAPEFDREEDAFDYALNKGKEMVDKHH